MCHAHTRAVGSLTEVRRPRVVLDDAIPCVAVLPSRSLEAPFRLASGPQTARPRAIPPRATPHAEHDALSSFTPPFVSSPGPCANPQRCALNAAS